MKFSKISSAQNHLLKTHIISVETDISPGLHSFSIVGLPDKAVEEARDRVSAAIKNAGFDSPKRTNAKIVVSLAPSHIKKEGPSFDLPIAMGYLLASETISFDPTGKIFAGELALDGSLRPVRGALSYARAARENGYAEIFIPKANAEEAALIEGISVFGAESLLEVCAHVSGGKRISASVSEYQREELSVHKEGPNIDDIAGQETAKRGLVIAAAGRHNIGLYGPPGTGKTMLARALPSILPALSFDEMIEVTEIHSIAGMLEGRLVARPPVRAPHHTASYTAIIGGGSIPRPGEITLAHKGVLFLDEFPEFGRRSIEALRQPLEDRTIAISRGTLSACFPADFILIAAFNPCPCGNKGAPRKQCTCTPAQISNYEKRISGPVADRIDIWIEVSAVEHDKLLREKMGQKETESARAVVSKARDMQKSRARELGIDSETNSGLSSHELTQVATMDERTKDILDKASMAHGISGRGYHRLVKLARTIADIEGSIKIEAPHMLEALQYREKNFRQT
ncbi:MAG TPA: YifB family Mg chelatase-like AAA ATPase [Candidatus Paceibacterota bacterium]|nr:YifB family Mg chelatase-like AAA ATPase [Candidatus Paceibacterota bacterium]